MNIIISSLSKITIVAEEIKDFDSAKLFISKSIPNQDKAIFSLTREDFTYPLKAVKVASLEKNEFYGYRLTTISALNDGSYYFNATFQDEETLVSDAFMIESNDDLIDEHDPVLIIGRKINPVTAEILQQDLGSQQITFYMRAKYDGVSFLDESKKVYIDFVPVDKSILTIEGKTFDFLSMELKNITPISAPNGSDEQWMALKWKVPYVITKDAGIVPFQITIAEMNSENLLSYIWQTFQSSITISKNIGFRAGLNVQPETEVVNTIIKRLEDLEEVVGYQSDDIADNDKIVILDCGWGGSSLLLVDEEEEK